METARPATSADLEHLVRLWADAVKELDGQRGGWALAGSLTRPEPVRFMTDALEDPDRLLVLGLIDAYPVGVASLRAERGPREPLGYLELIFVEPDAREVGVAAAMLTLVERRCQEWGMAGLDAPALPGNRSAKGFFERHGMQARLLVMYRSIGEDGGD